MALPNVIIAGAPKCGTTSVFTYLSDHPQVCSSRMKETYYFIDRGYPLYRDARPNYQTHGLAGYESYFRHCSAPCIRVVLEATPDYMYQRTALEALPTLSPPPTLVFILRKPSDRVWSLYKFAQNNVAVLPQDLTFSVFIQMVKEPDNTLLCDRPILRDAIAHSKYINYLMPFQRKCGDERIQTYILEDLDADPGLFMRQLCSNLGIGADVYRSYRFSRKNATVRVKNQALHRVKRRLVRVLPRDLVKRDSFPKRLYRWLNVSPLIEKSSQDMDCISALDVEFQPYNEQLAEEMDMDLSRWQP